MDLLQVMFPVAGIKTYLFIPPVVAFTISFFTSTAGISGAFLLLHLGAGADVSQQLQKGWSTASIILTPIFYHNVSFFS